MVGAGEDVHYAEAGASEEGGTDGGHGVGGRWGKGVEGVWVWSGV